MKPCRKCGSTDRYKNGNCRPCSIANSAAWRAANIDKCRAIVAAWHKTNQDKSKANSAAWRAANLEKSRYNSKTWYKYNLERHKANNIAWKKAHPEYRGFSNAARRAAKLNATPSWANDFFIKEIYHLAKLRTKMTGIKWHVDHIVPLKSKLVCGLHCEANLQVIPAIENLKKHNSYWPDMPT